MKKIGLIGGMSWESTVTYYRIINEKIGAELGGSSSADMIIRSLDLAEIERLQDNGRWDSVADILIKAAHELESAGADFIVMASNTVHKVYDEVAASVNIPIIHIADPTVDAVQKAGVHNVGLLGTRYTMEGDFLKEKMESAGISVMVPSEDKIQLIHRAIFSEGVVGKVSCGTRALFTDVINEMAQQGAQGVVLGCTELGLMIAPEEISLSIFDTAVLHAEKAVKVIMNL